MRVNYNNGVRELVRVTKTEVPIEDKFKPSSNNHYRVIENKNKIIVFLPGINRVFKNFVIELLFLLNNAIIYHSEASILAVSKKAKNKNKNVIVIGSLHHAFISPCFVGELLSICDQFIGVQHGGDYCEIPQFELLDIERRFSDKYIVWNLKEDTYVLPRFGLIHKALSLFGKIGKEKNIYIVASSDWTNTDHKRFDCTDSIIKLKNRIRTPEQKKIIVCIHPAATDQHKNMIIGACKKEGFYYRIGVPSYVKPGSRFIIDGPFHTFLYRCIACDLPFTVLWSDELYSILSTEGKALYRYLDNSGLLTHLSSFSHIKFGIPRKKIEYLQDFI